MQRRSRLWKEGEAKGKERKGKGGGGLEAEEERAGTRVGCPGVFQHSFPEFKAKIFPSNTWSAGRRGTDGIKRKRQIKVQESESGPAGFCVPHTWCATAPPPTLPP